MKLAELPEERVREVRVGQPAGEDGWREDGEEAPGEDGTESGFEGDEPGTPIGDGGPALRYR